MFMFRFSDALFLTELSKKRKQTVWGDVVSMLRYAAVHFQYITEVIILKRLQLVICQAHFTFSWWPADKCLRVCQKINNRGIPLSQVLKGSIRNRLKYIETQAFPH